MSDDQPSLFEVCAVLGMTSCTLEPKTVCRCDLTRGHEGNHKCAVCYLAFTPTPPSGPQTEVPERAAGSLGAYNKWRETEQGEAFFEEAANTALAAERFSTRAFVEEFRRSHKLKVNNDFSIWLADELITTHPDLEARIERRVRKRKD